MATPRQRFALIKAAFFLVLEFGQVNRLFRRLNRGKVKVLLYHSITPRGLFFANGVAPADFSNQVKYLRQHYHVMDARRLDSPNAYVADRVNVLITFDDGFKDNRNVAFDVLQREQLNAIFFVIAECLEHGDVPAFVRSKCKGAASVPAHRTIDRADVTDMLGAGMEIGAHGTRHDDYAVLDYQAGVQDAAEAKRLIQGWTGVPVANFAFPWGRCREGQAADLLRMYRRVFLTEHGFNDATDRVMFRNEVSSSMHLRAAASGSLDFFRGLLPRPRT